MEEIDLRDIYAIILKRRWMIALITLFAVSLTAVVSFLLLDPVYEAETRLMVLRKVAENQESILYSDLRTNRDLASTYSEIARSRTVSQQVLKQLKLPLTPDQLQEKVTVTPVGDTGIISLKVRDHDPDMAKSIANKEAAVFQQRVKQIMNVDNVQIIDLAVRPTSPVAPRPLLNMAVAAVLGVMVSVFLAFLLDYLDTSFGSPEEVEKVMQLPVLGVIPMQEEG